MKKMCITRRNGPDAMLTGKWVGRFVAVLAALFLSSHISHGGKKSELDRVVKGVQKRYEKIDTYKVSFNQTLTSPVFKKVIREASGVIYYAKPGKIRWEYKKPEERLYLIDGEFFWDYDPKAKQVLKVPVGDALAGDIPHGFLFGAGDLRKDFKVKLLGSTTQGPDVGYRLSLEPRDKDLRTVMSDLLLIVDPDNYGVVASTFTDAQGNINHYSFSDIVVNPKLKPELFKFKIPHGVKVILPVTESELAPHRQ